MMAAMAVALASGAGAQSVETYSGKYSISACFAVKDGIQCDMTYTGKSNGRGTFDADEFQAVTPDGRIFDGKSISVGGKPWGSSFYGVDWFEAVPFKISVVFPAPTSTTRFAAVAAYDNAMNNVAVRTAATPPAPAPAATLNIAGNWNATLTNCKQTSPGVVVCTATLKK